MKLKPLVSLLLAALVAPAALASPSGVVISQVYGGGGNSGATLTHDFVELFNAGSSAVSLKSWSLQYASSSGKFGSGTNTLTLLPDVSIQPGRYFLVQMAKGSGGSQALPTPDHIGGTAMGGGDGKIALVPGTTALDTDAPSSSLVEDVVSYGSATAVEGTATPALSSTKAALRNSNGCSDSGDNSADFTVGAPAPRNSTSAAQGCDGSGGGGGGTPPTVQAAAIYAIQGSGNESPLKDQTVSTSGVVTHLTGNGFYLQDRLGDGKPDTSDGIFVFTSSTPTVTLGQELSLNGKVTEFVAGSASADAQAHPITELTSPSNITVLSSGHAITPTEVDLSTLAEGGLEAFEGMLVTLKGPLTVQQNYFLGRFGQLTIAAGGRLQQPTNLHRPGSADALALAADNARRMILLDDNRSSQNPDPTPYLAADDTVRAGDTSSALVGVIDFGLATSTASGAAMYKLQPTQVVSFTRSNPRSEAPAAAGGNIKVVSANVLNYFTTFTNGQTVSGQTGQGCSLGGNVAAANCRGADSLEEFQRQQAKIVASLSAINADVVGLMELQNNGDVAAQNLADALNAKLGTGTYQVVPKGSLDSGTDAIRVGLLYKPGRLALHGSALSDTDAVNNRPTFAQAFAAPNGERFAVLVNHLKSKSSCPASGADTNQGDGQGCWSATRTAQALRLRDFAATVQAAAGTPDLLLIGDFNAYAQEDPLHALTHDGFAVDQEERFDVASYSYVFDGLVGRLDHALATPSLSAKIVSATPWHINADEPSVLDYNLEFKKPTCASCGPDYFVATAYRSSDHDPVVLGLNLVKAIEGGSGGEVINGTAGDDMLTGGLGRDTLTGGGGRDQFVYKTGADGPDTITDFTPGDDVLDFSALLRNVGIASTNPLGQGFVSCATAAAGAVVGYDPDGSAGAAKSRPVVTLKGVACTALTAASFKF